MAVCTNCGASFDKIGRNCPKCHAPLTVMSVTDSKTIDKYKGEYDGENKSLMIMGVILSIVGYIYYFLNKETSPLKAKSALSGALVGTVIKLLIISVVIIANMFK